MNITKALLIFTTVALCLLLCGCASDKKTPDNGTPTGSAVDNYNWQPDSPSGNTTGSASGNNAAGATNGNSSGSEAAGNATAGAAEGDNSGSAGINNETSSGSADENFLTFPENDLDIPYETGPQPSEVKYRVVLDPGHGGSFSGAVYDGRTEKKLTLKIAEYTRDYLNEYYPQIEVFMTRESDIELDTDLATELEKRAIFAKEVAADIFVSLHLNASDKHDSTGAVVYYSLRDNVGAETKRLAQSILNRLVALGIKDRGIETRKSNDLFDEAGNVYDYYAVIRHNSKRDIPAVIVEHCFIDNGSDAVFLADENALKRLARADAEGIAEYLGLNT